MRLIWELTRSLSHGLDKQEEQALSPELTEMVQ
jgi:hypothetical protein